MKYYVLLLRTALATGGIGTITWTGENYRRITYALENPDTVDPDGRLGAMVATRDYTPDQVGYGVHAATQLIYLVFRDIGEQQIGKAFGALKPKQYLESPGTFENHKIFGAFDQGYWKDEFNMGKTTADNMVIGLGASLNPTIRAITQKLLAGIRQYPPLPPEDFN